MPVEDEVTFSFPLLVSKARLSCCANFVCLVVGAGELPPNTSEEIAAGTAKMDPSKNDVDWPADPDFDVPEDPDDPDLDVLVDPTPKIDPTLADPVPKNMDPDPAFPSSELELEAAVGGVGAVLISTFLAISLFGVLFLDASWDVT